MALAVQEIPQSPAWSELLRTIDGVRTQLAKQRDKAAPFDFDGVISLFDTLHAQTRAMHQGTLSRAERDAYWPLLQAAHKFTRSILSYRAPAELCNAAGQLENYQPFLHISEQWLRYAGHNPLEAPALPIALQEALTKATAASTQTQQHR